MRLLEELFENFCEERDLTWWEVFDSELFHEFLELNHIDTTTKEFQAWNKEMVEEL